MNNLLFSMADLSASMVESLNNSLGIWYLIILNAFGVIAIICKILEYQSNSRLASLTLCTVACICWVAYFGLYGDFTSALTCFISIIRLLVFMQMGKHAWADSKLWVVLFFILQTLIVIFTFRIESIFAALAGFVGIAAYLMIDQRKYRALSFIYMALWVANGIINFYPIALISDSLSVVSVSIAIYRYDLCKNARKLQKAEKERAKNEEIEKNQD
ncbi:MAG: YgjV family protein [Clostridia bacterium]|nr:YgjV family protein [Clostridia bacterium]